MSNPPPTSPTAGTTLPQLPRYESFADFMAKSPWWARLKSFGNDKDVEHLRASIQHVAEQAESIASRVTAWMPFYTLHDRRHQLNLLAFIDVLAPEETLAKLFPLEIALTILGVLTHDLGMALPEPDWRKLLLDKEDTHERRAYLQFAEGRYSDELRQAERLMRSTTPSDQARGQLIQQHVLSEYLRSTHAPPSGERINTWLNEMKRDEPKLFCFNKTDYQSELKAIAASHNQPVDWLRSELTRSEPTRKDQGYHYVVRTDERVNFALPGLLLRLADIMDFDSTRTPAILFRHLGLNEDLGIDLSTSQREWRKHLAVEGIEIKEFDKQPTLIYAAPHCPHPVVQKSIHEFVGWIAEEVRGVREENRRQWHDLNLKDRACELWLPEVKAEIRPKKQEDGQPSYIYEDIQFKLDQDEILQLLMGERLYGDPTLCIRELLQNALDACEMRDLRLQMKAKKQKPFEPVDGIPSERGWYLDHRTGEKRRLEICLSWGFDEHEQRYWLQVEDNGVGMTQEVVKRYFTQIGKSYYRSPEFRQEQAALRAGGMFATPISQFGIGILSCFMLADRIEVQTCPGESHPETRPARDITISGPGSLFWLRKGTRTEQGTTVKLWLKTKLGQQEFKLEHDPERWLAGLRAHFRYARGKDYQLPNGVVDPAFAAGQWIIWPRYPVLLNGPQLRSQFEINGRFHLDHVAPIDETAVKAEAAEWGAPESVGRPVWGSWEWEDSIGPESTGSRVRLWFPLHDAGDQAGNSLSTKPQVHPRCHRQLLAAFTESQFESVPWRIEVRERLMLHGIDVPEIAPLHSAITIGAGVGTHVWFDLRGAAGVRLTADRKTALALEDANAWMSCIDGLTARLTEALKVVAFGSEDATRALFSGWSGPVLLALREKCAPHRLRNSFQKGWLRSAALGMSDWQFVVRAFEQELSRDHGRDPDRVLYFVLARDIDRDIDIDRARARDRVIARSIDRARNLARAIARAIDLDLDLDLNLARDLDLDLIDRAIGCDRARDRVAYQKFHSLSDGLKAAFLQESFFPDLRRSWAGLDLFWMRGMIGDAMLAGPELLCFEYEADGCTVHPTDLAGEQPREVVRWGYDLVFPTTAVPLGLLRRRCAAWRQRREPRRLGILPFICPSLSIDADVCAKFRKYLGVERIYALLPSQELWSKPFAEWQDSDWQHGDNLSALWDLENNIVRWAHGAQDVDWIRQNGLPAAEFFGSGPSE